MNAIYVFAALMAVQSVSGQVYVGGTESQYQGIIQKHQKEIALACATTMTNIQNDLKSLAQKYPPLSDMESAHIVKFGAEDSGNVGFEYKKNIHYEIFEYPPGTPISQMRPNRERSVVDKDGAELTVYIINLENSAGVPLFGGDTYSLLSQLRKIKFQMVYRLYLSTNDSALEKAVKDIIEKQVNLLTTDLQSILGKDISETDMGGKAAQVFSPVLTNILEELQGLAGKNPLLSDIGSATIENRGTNYFYQHLRYWKNAQAGTETNSTPPFGALPVVEKDGLTLDVYILKADEPFGFVAGNGRSYTFVSANGKNKISLICRIHSGFNNSTNYKEQVRAALRDVDDVIREQALKLYKETDTMIHF